MSGIVKGFRDFILRGNVVELAVAVVIGIAFTALVSAFTTNLIEPLLARAGGVESPGFGIPLSQGAGVGDATFIDLGAIVTAALTFLITAAVVYFLVVAPLAALQLRRQRGQSPPVEVPPEDTVLLREIRDLLSARDRRS